MAQFIGLAVLATLREPPAKVRGLVTAVVEQELTLHQVIWLSGKSGGPETLVVHGSNVLDVQIIDGQSQEAVPQEVKKGGFVDPAIVSYTRPEPTAYPDITTPSATLTAPFNDFSLNEDAHEGELSPIDGKTLKYQDTELLELKELAQGRTPILRKRARKSRVRGGSLPTQIQEFPDKRRGKVKGWRQTPFLEESTAEILLSPTGQHRQHPQKEIIKTVTARSTKSIPRQPKSRRRLREEDDQNGWATGDATDIQDMENFDFEKNLSRFDKRKVFDQIRQEDTTADEARLVSINRLPASRSGTAGGKNLHYSENVLDSPIKKGTTGGPISHVGLSSTESETGNGEAKISSGRSSRRNLSRASKPPSRKSSALLNGDYHGSGSTFVADPVSRLSRQGTDRTGSPKIKTESSTSLYRKSSGLAETNAFRIALSNGDCPCISPLQMLELEQLSMTELNLTEEMLTENSARCISETAYGLTSSEDAEQVNHRPLIVILAGNTKTGSRAIAAGRHLRNHGARVVLCILGLERELDLLESVQRQLKVFRSCGGQAIKQDNLTRTLRKLQAPTDLIVDALLGMHLSFDELRTDDQAAYFQLVCWANGSEVGTLAIDVPSGIDPSNGIPATHDGTELVITANFILSLGAPKQGLLTAMHVLKNGVNPSLFVADIGIPNVAWKKLGTRRKRGVEFAGEWVAALRLREGGGP